MSIKTFLYKIITFLKDILSPKKCFFCWLEWIYLCDKCFNKQKNFDSWFCYICKKESKNFKIHKKCLIENKILSWANFNDQKIYLDRVIVLTHYKNDVIKKLIKHFKFYWKKDIGEELAELLWKFLIKQNILYSLSTEGFNPLRTSEEKNIIQGAKDPCLNSNLLVLPVPLHFFKKIKRWFNQSEIIAEKLSEILNINYNKKILIRKKYTRQQSKLSRQERLNNLEDSFKIKKNQVDNIDNKIILLVDDVISTWTTLNEIAKILKQNWAKKVIWVCIASN